MFSCLPQDMLGSEKVSQRNLWHLLEPV